MYRLLNYIALIGFFNTLVENKLLNKYDPNLCVLHINSRNSKTAGGTLFYDVSRVSGIQNFTYDVDESDFFPVNTVISVNIFLCSYMRPQTERLICKDKSVQPPAACVIITNNSTKAYHLLQNLSVSQSSTKVAVIFDEGDTNNNSFSLKILLTESSEDKFFSFPVNSMFITIEWHSEWFKPAFEQQAENSCQIQVDRLNESNLFDMSSITQTPLFGEKFEFILTCTNVKIIPRPGLAVNNDVQGTSQFDSVNSLFVYSSHKGIFIRYYGVDKGSNFVQFNFKCVSGKTIPVVKTVLRTENMFDIYSTLFCPKKPFCQETIMNNHIGYSFDALAANVHNYEVPVTNKSKIMFNICHNLLPTTGKPFTGGDILAALDSEDGRTINLGVEQSFPAFDNDGQILVHYRGGDSCKEDPTINYSFSVKLLCNRVKSSQPVLVWAKDCHYEVQWESKAGCLYQVQPFSECFLQGIDVPNFNLTSINTSEFKTPGGKLAINPCGYINESLQASAVLKQNGGTELTIGKGLPKIEMRDGAIFLTIKGPPCQQGVFFSRINAEFVCQSDMTKNVQPIVQIESCTYNIKWFTNTTCKYENSTVSHCHLETDSKSYNLTALSQGFYSISDQNQTIDFAVCSSLTGPAAVLCGPQSSACWISNELVETNYSSVAFYSPPSGSLSVEGDKLVAHYSSTVLCNKITSYSFKLIFEYAPGISDTKLEFEKSNDKCQVVVKLKTKHSLSTAMTPPPHNATSHIDSCRRSLEPKIDLTHLRGRVWDSVVYKAMISICGPLPAGLTDEGSGACLVMDGLYKPKEKCISIGLASDVLLYKPRLPYLNYSGPGKEVTFVTFPCDSSQNPITFTSLDDITHVVSWPTSASCLNTTADRADETCTSEHLSRYLGKYKVDIKDSKQYILIGLCVKLPSECLEGTAACLVDTTNSLTKYMPIGYHAKNISTDNFGNTVLKFKNGALCNRSGQQYTTILKLICENSNKTYSTYEYDSNNCIHLVEFKGLIGCKTNDRDPTNDSEKHEQINIKKNDSISLDTCSTNTLSPVCLLENLAQTKPIEVSNNGNSHQYLVDFNLNGNTINHCGVSVCRYDSNRWKPVANYHNVTYFEQNNTYKLEYQSTSPNPSCIGYSGAEIFLHCNVDKSTATSYNLHPRLKWENECSIGIEWVTDLACLHPKNAPSSPTSTGYNWTMISLTILAILFPCIMLIVLRKKFCKFLCQHLPPFRSRFRSDFLRVYDHSSLSSLSNVEETTVLFVNPRVENLNDSLI